ncbi:MAG: hypothetical protein LBU13_07660 [Synergistaceae bacterium]|jgi:hypothetical protein|nr:hypothetical protein [Synergistaceae bacterium]
MKIMNRHTTSIGFGTLSVLPDTAAELPREFTADHPVVKFYIGKKWIEIVGDVPTKGAATAQSVNVGANIAGTDEIKQTAEAKSIDRMKLEELRATASELDIEYGEDDTRQMLIDKIKATKAEKTE